MKEFDFDELDKAVSSLMGSVPADQKKATATADSTTTMTISDASLQSDAARTLPAEDLEPHNTISVDDSTSPEAVSDDANLIDEVESSPAQESQVEQSETYETAVSPTVAAKSPLIAPRKSGRFMDMVHASGDPTQVKKAPSERPTRIGRTVAPSQGAPIVDVVKPTSSEIAAVPRRSFVGQTSDSTPKADDGSDHESVSKADEPLETQSNDMMSTHGLSLEPISSSHHETKEQDGISDENEDDKIAEALANLDTSNQKSLDEPAVSPFLPDAKVEKRPLGGDAVDANHRDDTKVESIETNDQAVESDTVPVEFSSDLMAIEAGEEELTPKAPEPAEQPAVTAPVEEKKETPVSIPAAIRPEKQPFVSTPVERRETQADAGPTSIPQQYREEPSSGDQSNGAIYDTANYHQPLAHPAKKKSSLWTILIIVIIILLGAGAGAFFYLNSY